MSLSWSVIRYMVNQYDYLSLTHYLSQYPQLNSKKIERLTQLGQAIIDVDLKTINQLASSKENFLTSPKPLPGRIYFYTQSLNIQRQHKEYADYLRRITPLLVDVFQWIIVSYMFPNWNQFIEKHFIQIDGKKLYKGLRFNEEAVKEKGAKIEKVWNEHYPHGFDYRVYISSSHLLKLIDAGVKDSIIVKKADQLRQIEKQARNLVAHEIVYVNDEWVKKRTGYTIKEIHHLLMELITLAGLDDNQLWNSLELINQQLLSLIGQQIKQLENNKGE
ncbi:hypothetical protein CJ205_05090 [Dolosicoccus paucivorans]|uniref:Csm6 HEPN domain-containing protein n=1 Tax=Dolosicoccus paucivorans TaxID=84521 RepID=A0A2N6SML1_9LACT|nr:hypothetical protein [Dolosicoccus paucivorans]PMB84002.1 hypothetical protein CJ206_06130 [Dolosicoccus paucivorans]PMC58293.1 hypothetical protein CJ205_05090 [Dolosicoccus paucivorans]